ncbi:class I SAM-dependent methyltransferase [Patescibacteria group bacterium]|nr:class I SAM-dependent methyltransferase [Patescibacteria group bacterium]
MKWDSDLDGRQVFTTPFPETDVFERLSSKDAPIMDLGCGYGRVLSEISGMGYTNLSGVDISPQLVHEARKSCPNADVSIQDFSQLDTAKFNQKYELILLMGVIEYLLSDEHQEKFFKRVSELLSENGTVFLETFIFDWENLWKNYIQGFMRTCHLGRFKNKKGFECHHQSEMTLRSILQTQFDIISFTRKSLITWSGKKCNGLCALLGKV